MVFELVKTLRDPLFTGKPLLVTQYASPIKILARLGNPKTFVLLRLSKGGTGLLGTADLVLVVYSILFLRRS